MLKRYIVLAAIFLSSGLFAQNVEFDKANFKEDKDGLKTAKDNLKTGDDFYAQGPGFYRDAIAPYEAANTFNPNNADLNFKLGECYLASMFKYKALPYLEIHKLPKEFFFMRELLLSALWRSPEKWGQQPERD